MRYLLDTNMVSHVIKGRPEVQARLRQLPLSALAISAVTLGELRYGLAKAGHPPALTRLVEAFLSHVDVLPWDNAVASSYGELRASCQQGGITLGALDMMIAAHARASDRILVSADLAFSRIPGAFPQENWMTS